MLGSTRSISRILLVALLASVCHVSLCTVTESDENLPLLYKEMAEGRRPATLKELSFVLDKMMRGSRKSTQTRQQKGVFRINENASERQEKEQIVALTAEKGKRPILDNDMNAKHKDSRTQLKTPRLTWVEPRNHLDSPYGANVRVEALTGYTEGPIERKDYTKEASTQDGLHSGEAYIRSVKKDVELVSRNEYEKTNPDSLRMAVLSEMTNKKEILPWWKKTWLKMKESNNPSSNAHGVQKGLLTMQGYMLPRRSLEEQSPNHVEEYPPLKRSPSEDNEDYSEAMKYFAAKARSAAFYSQNAKEHENKYGSKETDRKKAEKEAKELQRQR